MSRPVVGDTVHVRATVVRVHENSVAVKLDDRGPCGWGWVTVPNADVVTVEPRPLQVGDVVRVNGDGHKATIFAIRDNTAWIGTHGGGHVVISVTCLERVP